MSVLQLFDLNWSNLDRQEALKKRDTERMTHRKRNCILPLCTQCLLFFYIHVVINPMQINESIEFLWVKNLPWKNYQGHVKTLFKCYYDCCVNTSYFRTPFLFAKCTFLWVPVKLLSESKLKIFGLLLGYVFSTLPPLEYKIVCYFWAF